MLPSHHEELRDRYKHSYARGRGVYDPIYGHEIRLLTLSPGKGNAPLCGRLDVVSLQQPPAYKAISYVWGTAMSTSKLHLISGPLRLTSSLHEALLQFRRRKKKIRLWADAICIRQTDVNEKDRQVKMMGHIYSQAQEVLVWLGKPAPSTPLAFWTIELLGIVRLAEPRSAMDFEKWQESRNVKAHSFLTKRISWGGLMCKCCFERVTEDPSVTDALTAVLDLWERPWFKRLWVLQEVALSRLCTFYVGRHNASFDRLVNACTIHSDLCDDFESTIRLKEHDLATTSAAMSLDNIIYPWREGRGSRAGGISECLDTLLLTYDKSTSRACDRLHSVRELSFIKHEKTLAPDSGVRPAELWRRLSLVILHKQPLTGRIRDPSPALMLALPSLQKRPSDLPSWVIDLGAMGPQCVMKYSRYIHESHLFCSGGEGEKFCVAVNSKDPGVLRVDGYDMYVPRLLP